MMYPQTRRPADPQTPRIVGIDGYNKTISGDVSMTVTAKRSDPHHVPLVIFHDPLLRKHIRFSHARPSQTYVPHLPRPARHLGCL